MGRKKREPQYDMGRRLQAVVNQSDLTLKAFHQKLIGDGEYSVAYQSVQNYHFDREAPAHYLARVAKVFGADLVYLVTGERSLEVDDPLAGISEAELEAEGVADPDWENHWDAALYVCDRAREAAAGTRFFGPHDRALGPDRTMQDIARHVRAWAGLPDISEYFPPPTVVEYVFPTKDEMEERLAETLELYALLDDLFANAWEGMQRILSHELGPSYVEKMTLAQQTRFRDAMVVALHHLFPDHGEPAASKELATDG